MKTPVATGETSTMALPPGPLSSLARRIAAATIKVFYEENLKARLINYGNNNFQGNINLTIPDFSSSVNVSFLWSLTTSDSFNSNSTSNNQTVQILTADDCSANTVVILNYTLRDEEDQTFLIGNATNTTIDIDLDIFPTGSSTTILNFSQNFSEINPAQVCLNINLTTITYDMDVISRYVSDDRAIEYHNIQNFNLSNSSIPQNINLFDLLTADSTEFQITFTDENFLQVENALIFINRQYIPEGVFKTVELPKTDSNGQTVGHFVRNDVVYNILVTKQGELLGSFLNIIAFCDDFTIGDCKMSLDATGDSNLVYTYDEAVGLIYSSQPTFDNATSTISFTFATVGGSVETVTMNVTRNDVFGNRTICDDTLTSSSGTLTCSVNPGIDETLLIATVTINGIPSIISNVNIDTTDLGSVGFVIWFILTLMLILMIGESKTGVMMGMLVSYIGAVGLGLIQRTIFGIGSAGIWILVITIMGIWKLNKDNPQ